MEDGVTVGEIPKETEQKLPQSSKCGGFEAEGPQAVGCWNGTKSERKGNYQSKEGEKEGDFSDMLNPGNRGGKRQ